MEWRSSLKRSQSLKAVTSDNPVWTDVGLQDKRTVSVSQLVARYQVGVSQQIQTTTRIDREEKSKEDLIQENKTKDSAVWRSHLQTGDLKDDVNSTNESAAWNNDRWIQPKSPTDLFRSKSLGSLHNIDTLKSKFEPKSVAPIKQEMAMSSPKKSANMKVPNGEKRKLNEDVHSNVVKAPVKEVATEAKQTGSIAKVKNNTNVPRRKTIGGIDFETLAASQAEEKRRSIADFRESSEKLCVSVKAISALYLSKVAPQEPKTPFQVPSSELGKRTRLTKMAEDAGYRATIGSMQQRRRKSELKRLLKHTHPEITMLDKVVDKELAAVLKSEAQEAAAETGYEGEVFSKCLIFENCTTSQNGSSYTANMAQGNEQTPTASVFEETNREPIEEERIDVQSTRKIFEEQSMKGTQAYQHKFQENVYNADKATPDQIIKKSIPNIQEESQYKLSDLHSTDQQFLPEILDEDFTSIPEAETFGETIKTSQDLFRQNPFITVNVEKEHSSFQSTKENIPEDDIPNVKTRKHLFESMPFDKIKQQNKDDIETMVENIRETLSFLYSANVLQSKGSIIEVHETMKATKVKFILTETGPEIMQDTVAEGGAQNFILHLLPRAKVEPHIKYLKEEKDGAVKIVDINVSVHQSHPDTEFKTANVVQLIEDILNQDNSLRKGVLIQEEVDHCAQVSVYSLYHYVDNEDIKSYCHSQLATAEDVEQETEKNETIQKEIPKLNSGIIKSAIHCLQESQMETCTTPERPDIIIKGNVKLFRNCIEKGDMEYLKSLQAEPDIIEEELPVNSPGNDASDENAGDSEYEPVDIKRLKGIFSADSIPAQPKPETCKNMSWSTSRSEEKSKKTVDHEYQDKQRSSASSFIPGGDYIHQAELVEVIDECEEISSLQVAISQLQKATVEAKSIHDSFQERHDKHRADQTALEVSGVSSLLKTNDNLEEMAFSKESSTFQMHDLETKTEDEEVVLEGKLQAALQALERSNLNVTRGGFEAAMIYRNSNKISSSVKATSCETTTQQTGSCSESAPNVHSAGKESVSQNESVMEKSTKPLGPKPVLPPKPEHLKANQKAPVAKVQIQNAEKPYQIQKEVVTNNGILLKQANDHVENRDTVQSQSKNTGKTIIDNQIENVIAEQKIDKEEPDESHLNFHEACQIFGCKKTVKTAPVKPKRVKIADTKSKEQSDSLTPTSCAKASERGSEGQVKVTMREKKGRKETEDERRQRLSVHMDEIMRGNTTAAMEIYDNLRKQEELENILIRVEEIEKDTSEVDVKSLKKVFEDVPDWVVNSNTKKNKIEGRQPKEKKSKLKSNSDTLSPMAHVFGDLARASEEIIHLKEQTLARLLDIEESIKKALCSVSNLKSESDIAGLSNLFKESLGASSGNISTISIGSSRTKVQDSTVKTNENQGGDTGSPKQPSPTSSPAFISISAARKTVVPPETVLCPSCQHVPKPEEFRTTKSLKSHSPAPVKKVDPRHGGQKQCPPKPKREVSVLEVQTDPKGTKKSSAGKKTITENYERTDNFGNKFYSTKTSTVLTTEPQTMTSCPVHAVVSPRVHQVSTHPEFQPLSQERCSACSQPVYSMERVSTDKDIFHKTCFCCKHCKMKLSMLNYASLRGDLYCTFHYKQLFRTKGNYDEAFDSANTRAAGV